MTRITRSLLLAGACALALAQLPARVRAQAAAVAQGAAQPAANTPATNTPATIQVSLEGIWMFDVARSDDAAKLMAAARPGGFVGRPPVEGGGGGGRGGHGGGQRGDLGGGERPEEGAGPGTGADADGDHAPRANPMQRVLRPAQKIVIEMLADEVRVSEDEAAPCGYALNDSLKAHAHELVTEYGIARWHGGKLEMKQPLGRWGALVETYELSADGRTLSIRARDEGGRFDMPAITRVYTRYEGD